jgi:hypothetical protein
LWLWRLRCWRCRWAQARCDFIARTPDICQRQELSEDTQRWCDQRRFAGEPVYNVVRLAADGTVRSIRLIETETGRVALTAYPYGTAYAAPHARDREIRMKVDALAGFLDGRPTPGHLGRSQRTEMDLGPLEHDEMNSRAKGPQLAAFDPALSPILNDATPGSSKLQLAQLASPSYAQGLNIGWNDSTGLAPSPCLNYTIQTTPYDNRKSESFSSTNAASSMAGQVNVSATVKGSVDAFSGQNDFSYSDNWQNSASSTNQYYNFYSVYTLAPVVDTNNPLNAAGQAQLNAGQFATSCGTKYTSTVNVGMLATISINYGSTSSSSFQNISDSFQVSAGLDSLHAAVSTANSESNSSSYFTFNIMIYGGGLAPTKDINTQYAMLNSSNETYYASCAAGNASDCTAFSSNMGVGATNAFTDFTAEVNDVAPGTGPNLSFFEIFPTGVAGVTPDLVPTTIPGNPANDILKGYKDKLTDYVGLLNQVSTLNNRTRALIKMISATPSFNPTEYFDLVGEYLDRLATTYSETRSDLLDNLNTCLAATDSNVNVACGPIINNLDGDVFAYYGSDGTQPNFFAQQNSLALQYATSLSEVGAGSLGSLDVMYIDKLPSLSAAGSNVPIAGQAAFVSFADRPWCCINGDFTTAALVAIVALEPDADISTNSLSESVQGSDPSHFTVWGLDVAASILAHPFRGDPGVFTSLLPCTPKFASLCAIDYTRTIPAYPPPSQYDNSGILDFFK